MRKNVKNLSVYIYIQTEIFFIFLSQSQYLQLFDIKASYSPDKSFYTVKNLSGLI